MGSIFTKKRNGRVYAAFLVLVMTSVGIFINWNGTPGTKISFISFSDKNHSIEVTVNIVNTIPKYPKPKKDVKVDQQEVSSYDDYKFYLALSSILTMMRQSWYEGRRSEQKYFDEEYRAAGEQLRSVMEDVGKQRNSDLKKLSDDIQERIWKRQNPPNCDEAKLLVHDVKGLKCGFGCRTHLVLMEFLQAFYSNRTFVLKSEGWTYDQQGWEHYMLPFGKCKYNGSVASLPMLKAKNMNERIVRVQIQQFTKYDWMVPHDVLSVLEKIHNEPFVWWLGNFIKYELRLQPWFEKDLQDKARSINFTDSIVGIHIRWGDKIGVNSLKHSVDEYMDFAARWFERKENVGKKKVIYVATEQSEAWRDLEARYRNYTFIGGGFVDRNKELDYKKRAKYANRRNELIAILTDVYFLSKCEYVVCTYSSNICRMLHEIMTVDKSEALDRLQSLDDKYYWFHTHPKCRVIEDHYAKNNNESIDLKNGDLFIPSRENFSPRINGYVFGTNKRTGKEGWVPAYKVEVIVQPLNITV